MVRIEDLRTLTVAGASLYSGQIDIEGQGHVALVLLTYLAVVGGDKETMRCFVAGSLIGMS